MQDRSPGRRLLAGPVVGSVWGDAGVGEDRSDIAASETTRRPRGLPRVSYRVWVVSVAARLLRATPTSGVANPRRSDLLSSLETQLGIILGAVQVEDDLPRQLGRGLIFPLSIPEELERRQRFPVDPLRPEDP